MRNFFILPSSQDQQKEKQILAKEKTGTVDLLANETGRNLRTTRRHSAGSKELRAKEKTWGDKPRLLHTLINETEAMEIKHHSLKVEATG